MQTTREKKILKTSVNLIGYARTDTLIPIIRKCFLKNKNQDLEFFVTEETLSLYMDSDHV
jgi:hypothetical protein